MILLPCAVLVDERIDVFSQKVKKLIPFCKCAEENN